MRKVLSTLAPLLILTVSMAAASPMPTVVTPNKITWTAGTGLRAGTQTAVLSGDPQKAGPYTIRIKIPANTTIAPHFHAGTENVTVLSGALWVGLGDRVDRTKMVQLPAGSYASMPAGLHHYATAKEDTIIQLHGNGPFTMTAVAH